MSCIYNYTVHEFSFMHAGSKLLWIVFLSLFISYTLCPWFFSPIMQTVSYRIMSHSFHVTYLCLLFGAEYVSLIQSVSYSKKNSPLHDINVLFLIVYLWSLTIIGTELFPSGCKLLITLWCTLFCPVTRLEPIMLAWIF